MVEGWGELESGEGERGRVGEGGMYRRGKGG